MTLKTASIRRGMLCIGSWHSWGGTSFQQVLMASFSCWEVFGWCLFNFFFTIAYRFSMGFKSGEFAGRSNTCTWQFSNHTCVDFAVRWSKILLEDEFIISKELFSSWYHEMFQDIVVNCCINSRFEEARQSCCWHSIASAWWSHCAPALRIGLLFDSKQCEKERKWFENRVGLCLVCI